MGTAEIAFYFAMDLYGHQGPGWPPCNATMCFGMPTPKEAGQMTEAKNSGGMAHVS